MAKGEPTGSTNHQVGVLVGKIELLTNAIDSLSKRFEEHLKEHRATWLWVFPTLLSLGTFIFMMIVYWGNYGGD